MFFCFSLFTLKNQSKNFFRNKRLMSNQPVVADTLLKAILKIFSDLVDANVNGRVALLNLLDLSAAFDTVNHQILIQRLETSYGLACQTLWWVKNLLEEHSQSGVMDFKLNSSMTVFLKFFCLAAH